MNHKQTANYINTFFGIKISWLKHGEGESLPIITKESVVSKLKDLKTNKTSGL